MRKGRAEAIVVGAGVYGLAAALALARAGRGVLVLDAAGPGAGASGGPVGALAPHGPAPWSEAKAAQAAALRMAEGYWRDVAALSSVDPGYRRVGRVIPLRSEAERARAEAHAAAARVMWTGATWTVLPPDAAARCAAVAATLGPDARAFGAVHETLSARIAPRRALAALAAAVAARGGRIERAAVTAVAPGRARLVGGREVAADAVVVAAGWRSGELLAPLGWAGAVRAVKGQALVLRAAVPDAVTLPGAPLVGAPGLWIVPHADGTVAVGSTSEADWAAEEPDALGDALAERAGRVCPWLRGAAVLERWAGLRPRAAGPAPVVGLVAPGLVLATGGFKTGLATAPAAGALVAAIVAGRAMTLPAGFDAPQALGAPLDI